MKTYRIFGFNVKVAFCIDRVKRLTLDIPDWADDTWTHTNDDGTISVRYFKGSKPFYIDLPKCEKADVVSVSKLYNKDRTGYAKNRKIVVDAYV